MPRKAKQKSEKPEHLPSRPNRISRLQNRNVVVGNHRTSMRHEPELWDALGYIAKAENSSINDIITTLASMQPNVCLTSAVRVFIVKTLAGEN